MSNDSNFAKLVKLRHWLHAHPEVSRQENETSAYLQKYIIEHAPPDDIVPLAGAAFAVVYNSENPGNTVLIRTELDALPIHEINEDLPYRSLSDGVGHKCGHDGHMTIVTGLAKIYANERPPSGRVVILFQHDEETGTGARECCEHPNFEKIRPDYAFALHNFPRFPMHEILCRNGVLLSSVCCVAFELKGKEAHSAMPETGVSPALAISEITQASQAIQNEFDTPDQRALIVPVHFQMGVASSGVAPGSGELYFTLRSETDKVVNDMRRQLIEVAQQCAQEHSLKLDWKVTESFSATHNDKLATDMIRNAARSNGLNTKELEVPFRAGEDFGEITARYRGAMFGIGSGENCPELHNPDYDFPDEIIPTGIAMFENLISQCLSANN